MRAPATNVWALGAACALGAALLAAPLARAQEQPAVDGYAFTAASGLGRLGPDVVGKKVYVEGRWHECWRDAVSLFREDASRRVLLVAFPSDLQKKLSTNKDSEGANLVPGVSNVRVFATGERDRDRGVVLRVERVAVLDDDVVRFRAALEALGATPTAEALARLGAEVGARAERFNDPRLRELAAELKGREVDALCAGLRPDDYQGALEAGKRLADAGKREAAITVYGGVEARAPEALRREARQRLAALRAVRGSAGWVPFEAFKAAEGFVRRDKDGAERWVTREQAELEAVIALEMAKRGQVVVVRVNPAQAGRAAEAGRLEVGQTLEEARVAVEAVGVAAVAHGKAADDAKQEYRVTQWVLGDGRRAYFLAPAHTDPDQPPPSAELVVIKAAREPLPEK